MSIRVGLESTKIRLTEVGRKWFTEHYPKGIVYEYDENGEFTLDSMIVVAKRVIPQIICPLGIPYRLPADIEGQTTFKMIDRKEAEY